VAIIAQSARYGVGIYGASRYGEVNVAASIAGVSATGSIAPLVAGGFEVDISERLNSVAATGAAGTVQPNITEKVSGVSASGSIGILEHSNTVTLTGVQATGSVNTVEEKPTEVLNSVSATGAAGTVQVNIAEVLAGVSATGFIGTPQPVVSFSVTLTGVQGTITCGGVEDQPTERITTGVAATGAVGSVTVHVLEALGSTAATSTAGTLTTTAVVFDFNAVRELYDRRRMVSIDRAA
jgi:hypothetical protein